MRDVSSTVTADIFSSSVSTVASCHFLHDAKGASIVVLVTVRRTISIAVVRLQILQQSQLLLCRFQTLMTMMSLARFPHTVMVAR